MLSSGNVPETEAQMYKNTAFLSAFLALAVIMGYVEMLVPLDFILPYAKLGIANLVPLYLLYSGKAGHAVLVNILRVLIVGLLFSNPISLCFSLCGALLSFPAMLLAKKSRAFSVVGVSIAGGVFHNLGQFLAAFIFFRIFPYFLLPVLLIVGVASGLILGLICKILLTRRLPKLRP